MVDKDIILAKTGSIKKYLKRINNISNITLEIFLDDIDFQDIILFNIQLAVQNCIDIAAHIVSEEDLQKSLEEQPELAMLEHQDILWKTLRQVPGFNFKCEILGHHSEMTCNNVLKIKIEF